MNKPLKRFYIDCTHTYFGRLRDGISRVTRNLVKYADVIDEGGRHEIHPVVFYRNKYYILPSREFFKEGPPEPCKTGRKTGWGWLWYLKKFLSVVSLTRKKRRAYREQLRAEAGNRYGNLEDLVSGPLQSLEESHLSKDDFLIFPEICQENQLALIGRLKNKSRIVFLIHDLIPLTHPEYCGDTIRFNRLFKFVAKYADLVVAVSKYSARCFEGYEKLLQAGGVSLSKKRITYFHLGCDLDISETQLQPAAEIANIYKSGSPVFLVCGTIEPRKNHGLVLETFHRLWQQGCEIKLLFIGRYGWNSEQTLQAMTRHPELNRRFFWISKCSDRDLSHAYQNCHALIFPSQVEGFGLPLVEALAAGKEVLFSRIESFQEIVPREFLINSFDPNKPEELLDLVVKSLRVKDRLKINKFKPVSWRQSVREFYRILLNDAESPPSFQAKALKRKRL